MKKKQDLKIHNFFRPVLKNNDSITQKISFMKPHSLAQKFDSLENSGDPYCDLLFLTSKLPNEK